MNFPVAGSRPTVYRPSQRPSFRLRMFPSPFARRFAILHRLPFSDTTYRRREKIARASAQSYQTIINSNAFSFCFAVQTLTGGVGVRPACRSGRTGQGPVRTTMAKLVIVETAIFPTWGTSSSLVPSALPRCAAGPGWLAGPCSRCLRWSRTQQLTARTRDFIYIFPSSL